MISAVLIYGHRGEILASRIYKEGLRRAVTDAFRVQVIANPEVSTPILTMGSTSFLHIRHNDLYVVGVSRGDVDAIGVFEILYKMCSVFTAQFGRFDEAACYRYVAEIYEIFDELVDYGYPQNTDISTLRLSRGDDRNEYNFGRTGVDELGGLSSNGGAAGGVVGSLRRTLTSAKSGFASSTSLVSGNGKDSHGIPRENYSSGNNSNSSGSGSGRGSSKSSSTLGPIPSGSVLDSSTSGDSDVPWRRGDVKHRRNEIYLDVVERINAVFDPTGQLISASVDGLLKVKAHLSGMPHCQVDLNNSAVLENSQLHACVDHTRFQSHGVVQFVPPEGEFDLLRYRVSRGLMIPFSVENEWHHSEHTVRIRCSLDSKKHFTNVVILVPLPPNSTSSSQKLKSSSGKAKFSPENTAVEWKIARLSGQHDATLRISTDEPLSGNGPIHINFSISMFTSSSLRVQSLQVVEETKYSTLKWVRYLTESGSCEARISQT